MYRGRITEQWEKEQTFKKLWRKSYGEICFNLLSIKFFEGVFKDHSNMVKEIILREAYEMKGLRMGSQDRLCIVNYI